jgi:hypothetical protein
VSDPWQISRDVHDPQAVPYFDWDAPVTNEAVRCALREGSEDDRLYWIARILREARYADIWQYVALPRWELLRPFWEFLIDAFFARTLRFFLTGGAAHGREAEAARWSDTGNVGREGGNVGRRRPATRRGAVGLPTARSPSRTGRARWGWGCQPSSTLAMTARRVYGVRASGSSRGAVRLPLYQYSSAKAFIDRRRSVMYSGAFMSIAK